MSIQKFECTAVRGFNNNGQLKKLDNGYCLMVLSVLEAPNSYGAIYDAPSTTKFLADSHPFMRRINEGYLRGELGHPKEADSPSYAAYVQRIHSIYETNVAMHIRKAYVDAKYIDPKGKQWLAIMGEVCPDGPHASTTERQLQNPYSNFAVSIRSMTTDKLVCGRRRKFMDNIITWDVVNEPGLKPANKFGSPSCESGIVLSSVDVRVEELEAHARMLHSHSGVSLESFNETMTAIRNAKRAEQMRSRGSYLKQW